MVKLEKVNRKTILPVIKLKTTKEQENYVASNAISLAQAWLYYDTTLPYAILVDEKVIGFIQLDVDEGERSIGIWRFMIDATEQKKVTEEMH
jgi:diamine N-acetyltransferase